MRYGILISCILISLSTWAQRKATSAENTLQIPSKKSQKTNLKLPTNPIKGTWAIGITTSTNSGIIGGFSFRKIWLNESLNHSFVQLDADLIKDYREFTSPYSFNGRTYLDGKLNQLIALRPAFGRSMTLFRKSEEGGPALKGIVSTGPSLGIQKPYYVDISYINTATNQTITTTVPYQKTLDNSYPRAYIIGSANFLNGFPESKLVPGWHLKTGLNLELESFKQNHMSVELGFCLDYFSKPIEMLNQTPGRSVYTTGYLTVFFGKSH